MYLEILYSGSTLAVTNGMPKIPTIRKLKKSCIVKMTAHEVIINSMHFQMTIITKNTKDA